LTPPPPPPPPATPPTAAGESDEEDEEAKKRRRYILLALLLLLVLLLCLGGVLWYLFGRGEGDADPDPSASAPVTASATTAAPSPSPSVEPSPTAEPSPTSVTIAIPSVVGKTAAEAVTILEGAGFDDIKVVLSTGGDASSADMTKIVIGVNPSEGTSVVGTTQIVLTVQATAPTIGNG
jgi:serine/threonine-protein kinase